MLKEKNTNYLTRQQFKELPEIERRYHIQHPIAEAHQKFLTKQANRWGQMDDSQKLEAALAFMVSEFDIGSKTGEKRYHPMYIFDGSQFKPKCTAQTAAGLALLRRLGYEGAHPIEVYLEREDHVAINVPTKAGDRIVDVSRNMLDPGYDITRPMDDQEPQLVVLAQEYHIMGKKDKAAETYSLLCGHVSGRKGPKKPVEAVARIKYRCQHAIALMDSGKTDESLKQIDAAQDLPSNNPLCVKELGMANAVVAAKLMAKGEDPRAAKYLALASQQLQHAIGRELGLFRPEIYESLGDVESMYGDHDGAVSAYITSLKYGNSSAHLYYKRGYHRLAAFVETLFTAPPPAKTPAELASAHDDITQAIGINPMHPEYYDTRARARVLMGRDDYSQDVERASQLYTAKARDGRISIMNDNIHLLKALMKK